MTSITTRAGKGAPLSWNEADANFTNLNNDKIEAASPSTLTNKTVNLTSNTLTGTKAQFDTACSDDNFAYVGQANTFTQGQTISSGNLSLSGTGQRITGDFSNATVNNRTMFQTRVANDATDLTIVPNGTATYAAVSARSSDSENASVAALSVDGATVKLGSHKTGSGAYLPMTFYTDGYERMRVDTSGNVGIGQTPARKLDVAGGARFIQDTAPTAGAIVIRQNAGDTVGGFIQWVNNDNSAEKGWVYMDTASNLIFGPGSSEKFRFGSSGQLGIGGANYGTAGQVLTSGGAGSQPTWANIGGLGATPSMVRLNTANGYGSTNNKIRRYSTVVVNQGSDITYADSATLGASFTINTSGVYSVSSGDCFNVASTTGISLNTTTPTTVIYACSPSEILSTMSTGGVNYSGNVGWTGYLSAGSVVRPHTDGMATGTSVNTVQFTIQRVA